jgi:hypothetical protein
LTEATVGYAPEKLLISDQGMEQLQSLTSEQVQHIREKAQTDLYFLSKGVLGYDQVEIGAHGALCNFMVREQANRRMVLMPRGHLKTTICTVADSIRLTLCDPNIRILIQNEVLENATDFLKEIKTQWSTNKFLRFLFPELVPERTSGPGVDWSKTSASLRRSTVSRTSTYMASGSGGSPQSHHFEKIKNDDLIGEKARLSEAEMTKSISWVDAQKPLLNRLEDTIDWYGTRKTMSDVYAHLMDVYKSRIKVFIREPIENGVPIFSKFPLEELMQIMTDTPDVWAYDYMNNPIGKGGLDWGKGLLRHYATTSDRRIYFEDHITGKPATWHISELDTVITVDPNGGKKTSADKAAVIVSGASPKDQIFVLEAWSDRPSPDELVEKIWELGLKWRPRKIGIEDAGQQNTLYYFEKKMRDEAMYFVIKPLKHNNQDKEKRIRAALDTPMKARRVYVQPSMMTLIGQIQLFPQLAAHNWDEIDALSYGTELWLGGLSLEQQVENEEAETVLQADRGITGYGGGV